MPKGTKREILLNFTGETSVKISSHTKLCSTKVKVCRISAGIIAVLSYNSSLIYGRETSTTELKFYDTKFEYDIMLRSSTLNCKYI